MHYSQAQRYIASMLQLFSHLLVFGTHFDSYFYDFFISDFDSDFLFHSINFLNSFLQLFFMFFCKLRLYTVLAFFYLFTVQSLYKFYCVQDRTLTLYYQLLNHVMGKLLPSPTTWSGTLPSQSVASRSQTCVNLCCPPSTNYPAT